MVPNSDEPWMVLITSFAVFTAASQPASVSIMARKHLAGSRLTHSHRTPAIMAPKAMPACSGTARALMRMSGSLRRMSGRGDGRLEISAVTSPSAAMIDMARARDGRLGLASMCK